MRFSSAIVALAALASSVVAQTPDFDGITSPTKDQEIPAGSSFDIIWEPGTQTGKVTISLLQGDSPTTLQVGPAVASSIDNSAGKYTWAVPASSFKTYGFKISLDSDPSTFQYSNPFHISGGSATSGPATKNSTSITHTASHTAKNATSHTRTHAPTSTHKVSNTTRIVNSTTSAVVAPTSLPVQTSSVNVFTTLPGKTDIQPPASTAPASSSPTTVKNAAVNTVVSSGFAAVFGGLLLAFAL